MRGVSREADAGLEGGGRVLLLPLGISARGVLVEEELDRRLATYCGVMKVSEIRLMKSTYIDHALRYRPIEPWCE